MTQKYKAVLFDFDGVLCHDYFYDKSLLATHPDVCAWISANVFADKELTRKWMRGQISSIEINEFIADGVGMNFGELNTKFEESIRLMRLDERLLELVERLSFLGIKIGIVTDNMDVFSSITVPDKNLNEIFNVILNSSDHGLLKQDENGRLFDTALEALDVNIENVLHIDDSSNNIELFKNKGGNGFLYKDFDELEKFLGDFLNK